jgi:hypothetical protein
MDIYFNINDVAKTLKITPTSVYKLMNSNDPLKKLSSINKDTYRGDGGYLFMSEEVEKLKKYYINEDLTPSQAAKIIGRSTSYVHQMLNENKIAFYQGELKGKKTSFIKRTDLNDYKKENENTRNIIFDKKTGAFLFQLWQKGNKAARLMNMKRVNKNKIDADFLTDSNQQLSFKQIKEEGWHPSFMIDVKKTISSFGFATFNFPIPSVHDSMIFLIIEELFKQIGPTNMRIVHDEERLIIDVKKSILTGIHPMTHPDMIDKMKQFITSGKVVPKYDGLLIDTGLSPITIHLSENKKNELLKKAKKEGLSLPEWIVSSLEREQV